MGHWIYNCDSSKTAPNLEYLMALGTTGRYAKEPDMQFANCIKKFFSNPEIIKLVKDNDWETIFKYWRTDYSSRWRAGLEPYGNAPGWSDFLLGRFLYFSDIDFWNYLPESFNDGDLGRSIEWVDDD